MRADILPVFTVFVIVQGYILSLIRLFQFTLAWGELENPPSPRGRLSCAKQQFIVAKSSKKRTKNVQNPLAK
jgi:hypothetical protein